MTREEAIKIVKEFINGTCLHLVDQKALETLIPELAESEDEKIRKTLIEIFSIKGKKDWRNIPTEKIIAWLEKQKEQKPIISDDAIREGVAHFGITQYQIDNWLKKHINVIEQKPTEWSEEDEKMLQNISESLCSYQCHLKGWREPDIDLIKHVEKEKNWLKSLRPQQKPNEEEIKKIRSEEYTKGFNDAAFGSKQEWSEEDKGLLLSTKCIIDEVWHSENTFGYSKEELEEIWNWLNVAWNRLEYPKENDVWSEDDLNRIRNLIFLVENCNEGNETKKNFVKFLQRLYNSHK